MSGHDTASDKTATTEVRVQARDNGPIIIRGPVVVMDGEGNVLDTANAKNGVVALCRCGHSNTKPFCDGTHRTCGFESVVRA